MTEEIIELKKKIEILESERLGLIDTVSIITLEVLRLRKELKEERSMIKRR